MATRYQHRLSEYNRAVINIDNLLGTFSAAEKSAGKEETFKKIQLNAKPNNCSKCSTSCKGTSDPKTQVQPFGASVFSELDFGDDDEFVCDLCSQIGYSQKYIPEICDTCKACEMCAEYDTGTCDGCSYSIYRDGVYYHTKLSEDELISEHDRKLFDSLNDSGRIHLSRGNGLNRYRNR